jgi:hypothetical protein
MKNNIQFNLYTIFYNYVLLFSAQKFIPSLSIHKILISNKINLEY